MSVLDEIISNHAAAGNGARIVSEQHDPKKINWVRGLSDPGEMVRCGAYQELRRHEGEADDAYAARLVPLLAKLPAADRAKIEAAMVPAALARSKPDITNGKIAKAFAGKSPWDGLGVVVDQAMTSAEAMHFGSQDWLVEKQVMSYAWNGETRVCDDEWAIVRSDTGEKLGRAVGSIFKPIQNHERFAYTDKVLQQYGGHYESVGSLYGGRKVWLLARMPKLTFRMPGTTLEAYIAVIGCHDGTAKDYMFPTDTRIECANTFRTAARDRGKGIGIRHTGNLENKIVDAQEALGLAVQGIEKYHEAAEVLYRTPCEANAYFASVLDKIVDIQASDMAKPDDLLAATMARTEAGRELAAKKISGLKKARTILLDQILDAYEGDRCGAPDSAWRAFNAVTNVADHPKKVRQVGTAHNRMSRHFESTLAGERDDIKQIAFTEAMALAR